MTAHGAGDLMLRHFATLVPAPVTTVTALASVTPLDQLAAAYGDLVRSGRIEHLRVVDLDEAAFRHEDRERAGQDLRRTGDDIGIVESKVIRTL